MIKDIYNTFFDSLEKIKIESFKKFSHTVNSVKPFIVSYFYNKNKRVMFIVDTNETARYMKSVIEDIGFPCFTLLWFDILPYENEKPSISVIKERANFLKSFFDNREGIYIVPVNSLVFPISPEFKKLVFKIRRDDNISRDSIIETLFNMGYERGNLEYPGQFDVKGDVVSIYTLDKVVKILLFEDSVERIKTVNEKGAYEDVDSIEVLPLTEFFIDENKIQFVKKRINTYDFEPYESYFKSNRFDINLIPFFYDKSVIEYFNGIIFFDESEKILSSYRMFLKEVKEMYYASFNINKIKAPVNFYVLNFDEIVSKLDSSYVFSEFYLEDSIPMIKYFDRVSSYNARVDLLKMDLEKYKDYKFIISCSDNYKLKAIFPDAVFVEADIEEGFIDKVNKCFFITEAQIFGKKFLTKTKPLFFSSSPIESFSEITSGEYVVHINYGIGVYRGIETLNVLGNKKDYIKLEYDEEEIVYIPVEQIFLIHKYMGKRNKPDKLGAKNWVNKKERVKKRMEEIASSLAILYQKRKTLKGIRHVEDNEIYKNFEKGFLYQETPDQLKAIEDVKKDMESDYPMDRLICGDVGYGKTEVAIRAALKAVISGKQVAFICPTTILAEQHYQTFIERLRDFPVNIQMLSRLTPNKEQKMIIKGLRDGDIDVVIGTHRLLSKDIEFKDLGLLIIDEEQRFGVSHKERIKQMKANIDALTLTATPIPRTLYMGLSNIIDMSIINTPPISRKPIKTHVLPFNENILKTAIQREIDRGGQVFIIHNRVATIQKFASFIKDLTGANVCFAHGQMDPVELESIFLDFIHKKYDIMVSTTIIENGIDIPSVNTIIIDKPETLGLSELYQLRGRVGRSDVQGYAYLFYDPKRGLTEEAMQRLKVIEENTELGSGIKIALHDLQIRGAGNLLGKEQSGFIDDVGIELYTKFLQEAISKVKEDIREEEIEPLIDISFNGSIPNTFIEDEKERFAIYKMIMRATSFSDIDDIREKIKERYGHIVKEFHNLLRVSRIKIIARKLGILQIKQEKDNIRMTVSGNRLDPKKIVELIKIGKIRVEKDSIVFKVKDALDDVEDILNRIF